MAHDGVAVHDAVMSPLAAALLVPETERVGDLVN
jgi:hypothetical protein